MLNYQLSSLFSWYRYLFLVTCAAYWVLYDGMKNSYISRIYQHDKYGVVLVFCLLSVCSLVPVLTSPVFTMVMVNSFIERAANSSSPGNPMQSVMDTAADVTLLCSLQILKMLCFTWIFKNNTSDKKGHQIAHVCCVFLMGISSLLAVPARIPLEVTVVRFLLPIKERVPPEAEVENWIPMFLDKLFYMLLWGTLFQLCGWAADQQDAVRLPPPRKIT